MVAYLAVDSTASDISSGVTSLYEASTTFAKASQSSRFKDISFHWSELRVKWKVKRAYGGIPPTNLFNVEVKCSQIMPHWGNVCALVWLGSGTT